MRPYFLALQGVDLTREQLKNAPRLPYCGRSGNGDRKIYFAGGETSAGKVSSDFWAFQSYHGMFTEGREGYESPAVPTKNGASVPLPRSVKGDDSGFLVLPGETDTGINDDILKFDADLGKLVSTGVKMNPPKKHHAAFTVHPDFCVPY